MTIRTVAIALSTIDGQMEANYSRARALCRQAIVRHQPQLILLPEAFAAGYCATDFGPWAEAVPGPTVDRFIDLARHGRTLICFGLLEKAERGVYNTAVLVGPDGILGVHRKAHLWIEPGRPYRNERALLLPGESLQPIATPLGKIGVLICYEASFAEAWATTLLHGADLILVPYNCECDRFESVRDCAGGYLTPVLSANRTGMVYAGGPLAPNPGSAFAYDHQGRALAHSPAGVEEIIAVDLDLEAPRALRRSGVAGQAYYVARRGDLYGPLSGR